MMRRGVQVTGVVVVAAFSAASARGDTEAAKVAADAVRAEGMPCQDPASAERDAAASKPDEAVWILECKDAGKRWGSRATRSPELSGSNRGGGQEKSRRPFGVHPSGRR